MVVGCRRAVAASVVEGYQLVDVCGGVVGLLVSEEPPPQLLGYVPVGDVVPAHCAAACFGQGRVAAWFGAFKYVVYVCCLLLFLVL